jgi:hypothetical protein
VQGAVDGALVLPAVRVAVGRGGSRAVAMSPVPGDAFEAAVARLDDDDLPVFAMLLDREPLDSIAGALRIDRAEVSWRAQRIVGRLRPRLGARADDQAIEAAQSHQMD